jgi:hypothetical protein
MAKEKMRIRDLVFGQLVDHNTGAVISKTASLLQKETDDAKREEARRIASERLSTGTDSR